MRCAVCGLRIRRAAEKDRPWLHDDPAYDPFKPPIHAPRPTDDSARGSDDDN